MARNNKIRTEIKTIERIYVVAGSLRKQTNWQTLSPTNQNKERFTLT